MPIEQIVLLNDDGRLGLVLYRACRGGTIGVRRRRSGRRKSLTEEPLPALIPKDLGFTFSLECRPVTEIPTPTPRELEILKVLWEQGPRSVRQVHRHL